jgi:succinylglutamic semialdehyde dehydrogenase
MPHCPALPPPCWIFKKEISLPMLQSSFQSFEPATGNLLWEGNIGDADTAVSTAKAAFAEWSMTSLEERVGVARRYADVVNDRAASFAELLARETGKPLWEAKTEIASVVGKVEISISAQADRTGERASEASGIRQMVRHRPHGVLAVIGPYNFPVHLPNGHIVPALLAGNTVVFKPSGKTPAVAAMMADCWTAAGLPAGVLNLVQGFGAVSRSVGRHQDIDGLLFTGSTSTGLALHRQFADAPHKILALEMGGNNPLIVWDVEDLEAAAHMVVHSSFLSAGQRCTSARRLIVKNADATALLEAIRALIDRLIVGAPFDEPQPFMGPVIDNEATAGLELSYAKLIDLGARAVSEMSRPHADLPFLRPGLVDVTGIAAPDEEYFGPILQVVRVDDFGQALAAANNTRFGLAAAMIGGDEQLYRRFWSQIRAGVVNWNRPTGGAASSSPFGGIGLSGNHRPSAYYAADYCSFPVASLESDAPDLTITTGLKY